MTKIMGDPQTCTEIGCERGLVSRGYCDRHYRFHKRDGTLPPIQTHCSQDGCASRLSARGLCARHYTKAKILGLIESSSTCRVTNCDNPVASRYMCQNHYGVANCYTLTVIQLDWMLRTPCEICEEPLSRVFIDHDHSCCAGGKSCGGCIRGSLCHKCNVSIGLMNENPRRMAHAYLYLQQRSQQGA